LYCVIYIIEINDEIEGLIIEALIASPGFAANAADPEHSKGARHRAPFLLIICRAVDAVFPENLRGGANGFPTRLP
jgi:hypothetical protein